MNTEVKLALDGKIMADVEAFANQLPEVQTLRDMGSEMPLDKLVRLALVRGLRALLGSAPQAVALAATPALAAPPAAAPMASPRIPPPPMPHARALAPLPIAAVLGDPGTETELGAAPIDLGPADPTPEAWRPWPPTRDIPDDENDLHQHYLRFGWGRFLVMRQNGDLAIYWSPYPRLRRDVPPAAYMAVTQDPRFDVCHVVPPDYKFRRLGANAAEAREAAAGLVPDAVSKGLAVVSRTG